MIKKEDLIYARDRFLPPKKLKPKVDMLISKVVGKTVLQRDPRLIKLIMKHRANKPFDSKEPDNFLQKPKFIEELKKTFNSSL